MDLPTSEEPRHLRCWSSPWMARSSASRSPTLSTSRTGGATSRRSTLGPSCSYSENRARQTTGAERADWVLQNSNRDEGTPDCEEVQDWDTWGQEPTEPRSPDQGPRTSSQFLQVVYRLNPKLSQDEAQVYVLQVYRSQRGGDLCQHDPGKAQGDPKPQNPMAKVYIVLSDQTTKNE